MKVFKHLCILILALFYQLSWSSHSDFNVNSKEEVQSYGVITGTVFGVADNPLPGTSIIIRNINLGTVTNLEGRFQLRNVPVGLHKLEIIYLDKDMLITRQKAPGGTNVFVKVDDAEV